MTSVSSAPRPPLYLGHPVTSIKAVLLHPGYRNLVRYGLLCAEACLCAAIIYKVPFTNIDWKAYMEQVQLFLNGERNYRKIRGDTGPLVYPAGFLWIFSALYYVTDHGRDISKAQSIFAGIYLLTLAVVFKLHKYSVKIPPYAYVLLTLSKRLHSLYVLRCFNDCVAGAVLYISIYFLCKRRYTTSSAFFSLALSVKMSVLLVAPAYALVLVACTGLVQTVRQGLLVVAIQATLASPFILEDWKAYLDRAFEFGRVFIHYWSLNWQFLPEPVFLSETLAKSLLAGHVCTLFLAVCFWCQPFGGLVSSIRRVLRHPTQPLAIGKRPSPTYILTVIFSCNIIGMLFARSIHYQFYAWEAHQLVFLLWQTRLPVVVRLAILVGIEIGYETFPANVLSSAALVASHASLVAAMFYQTDWRSL